MAKKRPSAARKSAQSKSLKGARRPGSQPRKGVNSSHRSGASKRSRPTLKQLWSLDDGITYSGITCWENNQEEFGLRYIDGVTSKEINVPFEFGNIMHYGLQYQFLRKLQPKTVITKVCNAYRLWRKKSLVNPKESQQLELLCGIAQITFPAYCKYWEKDDSKVEWIGREEKFDVPYTFDTPDGPRTIRLRGMRDGLFRVSGLLGLLETKNKSKISEGEIRTGLEADMQTLFYSFVTWIETGEMPKVVKYNIIRRATDQSPYRNVGMGDDAWLKKLQGDIVTRPDFYFSRFRVDITERNLIDFKTKTLDPLLCRFVHWWDHLKKSPVGEERFKSPYHSLNLSNLNGKYGKVDLWEALVNGNYLPYRIRTEVFPELADSFQVT